MRLTSRCTTPKCKNVEVTKTAFNLDVEYEVQEECTDCAVERERKEKAEEWLASRSKKKRAA